MYGSRKEMINKISYLIGQLVLFWLTVLLVVLEVATLVFIAPAFIFAWAAIILAEGRETLSLVQEERSDSCTKGEG
jgi:hypothetical protein